MSTMNVLYGVGGSDFRSFIDNIVDNIAGAGGNSTSFSVVGPGLQKITAEGGNFQYSGGVPVSGTVTRVVLETPVGSGDRELVELVGFSIPLSSFFNAAADSTDAVVALFGNITFNGAAEGDIAELGGGNDTLFGFGGVDILSGAGGNDTINGGAGADSMSGGTGNDFFYVDNASDKVIEASGSANGQDMVLASVSYKLGAAVAVEALVTTSKTGTAAIDLTGNNFAQAIAGNNGNNILRGYGGNDVLNGLGGNDLLVGGVGVDIMAGGTGNDIFQVENASDRVIETAGAANGADAVFAFVNYSLAADAAIESLATNAKAGTAAISLVGNNFAQTIGGNNGANILSGLGADDALIGFDGNDRLFGGLGNDRLSGGAGNDLFVFNTQPNATSNHDIIADFSNVSGNNDTIYLENSVFTALAVGGLGGAFAVNTTGAAAQADDRIIYNSANGNLYYDSNGTTAGGSVLFATLSLHPTIAANDFVVI